MDLSPRLTMILECGLSSFIIGFLILFIFYKASKLFRFYMDYLMYNIAMIILAFTASLVGLLRPGDVNNFYRCAKALYWVASKFFKIKVKPEGLENIPDIKQNFIIVSNHQSSLDMLPILYICPPYTTFVAKRVLLFAPFFGFAAWLSGTVFINRGNAKSALGALDAAVQRLRKEKMNLWIFPEGTRSQTGTMKPFKKGAFHMAQQAQIPIVPVVVENYIPIFNKKNKTFVPGTIHVKILPPVSTKDLTAEDVTPLMEKVQQDMLQVFHEEWPNKVTDNSKLVEKDKSQ